MAEKDIVERLEKALKNATKFRQHNVQALIRVADLRFVIDRLRSPSPGWRDVLEKAIARLELHWKSCMSRGDKRGDDMAEGINLAIESIRSALSAYQKATVLDTRGDSAPSPSGAGRAGRMEEALRHYAKEYCEGWCKESGVTFDDCGGCRARIALLEGGGKDES